LHNVLKAAGETVQGKGGSAMKLVAIDKLPDGDYKVQVTIDNPSGQNGVGGMMIGNAMIQAQQVQIQFRGGGPPGFLPAFAGNVPGLPDLLDAQGNKFQAVQVPSHRMTFNNFNSGLLSQEITIIYRGRQDPDSLCLRGSCPVSVTIPFAFQNVALE